jgi:hypothetical protein
LPPQGLWLLEDIRDLHQQTMGIPRAIVVSGSEQMGGKETQKLFEYRDVVDKFLFKHDFDDRQLRNALIEAENTLIDLVLENKKTNSSNFDRLLRVFLCHSSDDKEAVRELYRRLSAEKNIDPWLDDEKLLPGQDWDFEIDSALRASDAIIVCCSADSVKKEGYVQKEISRALNIAEEKPEGTIFIIPLRLDECQLPRRLSRWQRVDLFDNGYKKLLRSLQYRTNGLTR